MEKDRYKVLDGQKYTGKHKVYLAGESFPESELFGSKESVKIALIGQKERIEGEKEKEKIYPAREPKIKDLKASGKKK